MNNGLRVVSGATNTCEPNTLQVIGSQVNLVDCNGVNTSIGIVPNIQQVALVAGTKAITVTGVKTTSKAFLQLVTPANASLTVDYQVVCTANTVTITALLAAKTINNADTSTINLMISI